MNFKFALKRLFTDEEILALLRILNGFSFLIYYTVALSPNWTQFFSSQGYISPEKFEFYPGSWLFWIWDFDLLKLVLFGLTYILIIFYTLGFFTKLSMLLLIPLQIGFHLANPLIIHEPQQLTNLLMVLLFMLPIDNAWSLKKGPVLWRPLDEKKLKHILSVMLLYLGIYYFFAGAKKIPDEHWISGQAVKLLASWPFLANDNFMNEFSQIDIVSKFFSWFTVLFELAFVFVAFTAKRRVLIYIGTLFHIGISLTLDVGLFFWAMIQWYPLLLISGSTGNLDYLFSKLRYPGKNA